MRRLSLPLLALPACLALTGCYYDPGYGYVRNGTGADTYYGTETTTTVVGGGVGYYDGPAYGYYGYGPGCCYGGTTVIYRDNYGRRYYGDRYGHGRPPPGGWDNHRPPPRPGGGGDWHGRPPPPGGWGSRGDDHRPPSGRPNPPPGGWQGGRPSPPNGGGWHGNRPSPPSNAGGGSRPPPSSGDRGNWRGRHND